LIPHDLRNGRRIQQMTDQRVRAVNPAGVLAQPGSLAPQTGVHRHEVLLATDTVQLYSKATAERPDRHCPGPPSCCTSSKAGRRKIVPSTATPPCIRRRVHTCCTPPWEVRGAPLTHQTTTRRDERTTLSR